MPTPCCRCREWPPWSPGKENQANLAIKPREDQPVCSKGTVFSSKHGSPPSYPIPDVKHPFHLQSDSKQLGGFVPCHAGGPDCVWGWNWHMGSQG